MGSLQGDGWKEQLAWPWKEQKGSCFRRVQTGRQHPRQECGTGDRRWEKKPRGRPGHRETTQRPAAWEAATTLVWRHKAGKGECYQNPDVSWVRPRCELQPLPEARLKPAKGGTKCQLLPSSCACLPSMGLHRPDLSRSQQTRKPRTRVRPCGTEQSRGGL